MLRGLRLERHHGHLALGFLGQYVERRDDLLDLLELFIGGRDEQAIVGRIGQQERLGQIGESLVAHLLVNELGDALHRGIDASILQGDDFQVALGRRLRLGEQLFDEGIDLGLVLFTRGHDEAARFRVGGDLGPCHRAANHVARLIVVKLLHQWLQTLGLGRRAHVNELGLKRGGRG